MSRELSKKRPLRGGTPATRSIAVSFARAEDYVEATFRFDDGLAAITVPELPQLLEGENPEELWSQTLRPVDKPWMYALAADSLDAMVRQNQVFAVRPEPCETMTYYVVRRRFTVFERTFRKPDAAMIDLAAKARAAIVRVRVSTEPGKPPVTAQTLLSYSPTPGMATVYDGLQYVEDETLLFGEALAAMTRAREEFFSTESLSRIHAIINNNRHRSKTPQAPDRPPIPLHDAICLFVQPMAGLDPQEMKEWLSDPKLPITPVLLAKHVRRHVRELFIKEPPEQAIVRFGHAGKEYSTDKGNAAGSAETAGQENAASQEDTPVGENASAQEDTPTEETTSTQDNTPSKEAESCSATPSPSPTTP